MQEQTIQDYLQGLSARTSTPGGGAVAALTGAQAAGLIAMVTEFSGKTIDEKEHAEILWTAQEAINQFTRLAEEDARNFDQLMAAYKAKTGIQEALKNAAQPPLKCLELSMTLIPLVQRLAEVGNTNLITDTGIAASLLRSMIESSEMNVLINLRSIKDESFNAAAADHLNLAQTKITELDQIVEHVKSSLR